MPRSILPLVIDTAGKDPIAIVAAKQQRSFRLYYHHDLIGHYLEEPAKTSLPRLSGQGGLTRPRTYRIRIGSYCLFYQFDVIGDLAIVRESLLGMTR